MSRQGGGFSRVRALRRTLLASTIITSGASIAVLGGMPSALAACSTSTVAGTTTLLCAQNTTTTNAFVNTNGNNPSTSEYRQNFNASIVGQIDAGVTIGGFGFKIEQPGSNHTLTFNNSGAIVATSATSDNVALYLNAGNNPVTYTGNGSISNSLDNGFGIFILNSLIVSQPINIGSAN